MKRTHFGIPDQKRGALCGRQKKVTGLQITKYWYAVTCIPCIRKMEPDPVLQQEWQEKAL